MRYAIISDIHSNLESLQIFLQYLNQLKIEKVLFLGDLVGYNANPNECIEILSRFNNLETIRGNHDRAIIENDYYYFSDNAKEAIRWTIKNISQSSYIYLNKIEQGPKIIDNAFAICHGSALDEDDYLLAPVYTKGDFLWLKENNINLLFFGHTHYQTAYTLSKKNKIETIKKYEIKIKPDVCYLINPGSLGQPRDNDRRASFAVYDSEKQKVNIIKYDYPFEITQRKIRSNNLPSFLAERLAYGR